jgi:HlyD family secretion protein
MTANVNVEIARRNGVLRVPNAALRFRPTNEIFAAFGQTPPQGGTAAMGGRGNGADGPTAVQGSQRSQGSQGSESSRGLQGDSRGSVGSGSAPGSGEAPIVRRGRGQNGVDELGSRGQFSGRGGNGLGVSSRMQNLSPEEREAMVARMRGRGGDEVGDGQARGGRSQNARGAAREEQPPAASVRGGATTIDALFGPLPEVESRGRVWIYVDRQLQPVPVRLGITDGQATELIEGDLQEGQELATNVMTGAETTRPAAGAGGFPPFMGGGRGGFDGRGGNRGGGNNRGGGR